ncbi:MAG: TonB-dependent receptor [Mucilaginibacter sp.]
MRKHLLTLLLFLFAFGATNAQVTTSTLTGTINDSKGVTLPGATVKATHQPTGTVYTTSTNGDGRYVIPNMRVGGPYLIEFSYLGYEKGTTNGITLRLGEAFTLNGTLSQDGVSLAEVNITGRKDPVMNSRRTGASTNISRTQLENLPTASRSLQDFTRLTPQAAPTASGGTSFGGTNNRYNNITIDGAVNNDVFGLAASGTPGGQSSTQPISLDAIQEVQIVLAPYDVSQGNFTGAGVNAITRSGTNNFEGSIYFYNKNQNLYGKNVLTGAKNANFSDNQYGFRVGGPIIKNKLFFFVNGEIGRRSGPLANNAGETGAPISTATAKQIADYTLTTYKYDVGSYGAQDLKRENNKIFTKLDWNINDKHQLTARYNYIDAFDDNLTRSATFFNFGNNAYKFANKQHVGIIELRSNFNQTYSNNLILGYSSISDARKTAGTLFPSVTIQNIEGVSGVTAEFGSQRSSVANELDQHIFEITDNVKINLGKHLLTVGTHNEFFSFRNLFINNVNGRWTFPNVAAYLANQPASVQATVSRIAGNTRPAAEFSAAQLGFYIQDEFEPVKNLKITAGLRMDIPVFGDKPLRNDSIAKSFPGYSTNRTPSTKPLWAPRLGFNYDVLGDRSLQIRGGTGIFTGRVPFVWLSNQYGNSGMLFSTVSVGRTSGSVQNPNLEFIADPNNQAAAGEGIAGASSNRAEVNLVSNDFKIPQTFRTNLAVDFRLPYGIIATLEGIYSKTINNVLYKDINTKASTTTLNPDLSGGADTRPTYPGRVDNANFSNVILLDNTNKGHTVNLTGQLQKTFNNGFSAMVAYTYTDAKSINDGTSSTALSNWEFVQIVDDPNNPPLAISSFQARHRIVGSAGYSINYGPKKLFSTGIALFYSGYSGQPFTYLINGNANADNSFNNGNDLFYVPRNAGEIKLLPIAASGSSPAITPEQQWTALDAFIKGDPYLSKRRGKYTERNGASAPFQHQFDLRITQEFGAMFGATKNRLQLTFDIFNVGNLLNKEWGRQYSVTNQAYSIVSLTNAALPTGGYTFKAPSTGKAYATSPFGSAWSGQLGIRYLFN